MDRSHLCCVAFTLPKVLIPTLPHTSTKGFRYKSRNYLTAKYASCTTLWRAKTVKTTFATIPHTYCKATGHWQMAPRLYRGGIAFNILCKWKIHCHKKSSA